MNDWPELNERPKKKQHITRATHKIPIKSERCVEFEVSSTSQLVKCNKVELVNEVIRLQNTVREVAVELGIARNTLTSGYKIGMHFASAITNLVRASWNFNL